MGNIIGLQNFRINKMFSFFKRTKIEPWEIEFLKAVFLKLSSELGNKLYRQVESGLLKGVMVGMGDIPNYVGFTYNSFFYNKFYEPIAENYKLSNISVKNGYSGKLLSASVYVAFGMINGYSVDSEVSKYKFENLEIDTSSIKKIFIGAGSNSKITSFLTEKERKFINDDDIYATTIENKDYYHLKELEDGDFIGIDENNIVYRITHDPLEILPIDRNRLVEIIANESR
ncbi:hypothetical protein [Pedobacter sp. FW305-3-2-15-E-R2A2]|uniref:hypothetical protein n=1 Tax=Pedobacter sp. FW305-3-2-15-E-R2A2 TaxID=3140251 RepID=UPI003140451A